MNKQDKIEHLKRISSKDANNAKWKEIARWNEQHADCLDDLVIIATRIRHALKEKGLSQKALAKAMEVSPQALTRIMKGRQNLTLQTIRRIENVLNIRLLTIYEPTNMLIQRMTFVPVEIYYNTQSEMIKYKPKAEDYALGKVAEPSENYKNAS